MEKKITQTLWREPLEHPKRVAAYARVSTGKDAMLHSLSAQVSYYSNEIQKHAGWLYLGVYMDEAQTGTKDSREGFQRLLADCRAGRVDLILTKSISRFARNTVTLLETVRELKAMGVDVFFEEQNIHTLSSEGELMLTILASYAQEESLSASENQKWRIRKGFENGELLNWRFLFGYRIGKNSVELDPDAAPIVREIYDRALSGETFGSICRALNGRGIACALGGKWCTQRIREMLSNEKYTGNAVLQKRFRNNHLEKRLCRNTGELPKFFAEETHPAIIDQSTYDRVQALLLSMSEAAKDRPRPQKSVFTGKINCPFCGKNYKRNTSNGTVGWNCSTYLAEGKAHCHGKKIPEATLEAVCAEALGTDEFSPAAFDAMIDHIDVPEDNHLRFYYIDGRTEERIWTDRSRRESWTDEMKEEAAERMRQRRKTTWQKQ